MTLEESFEPVVMFFRLTNSLTTFQTIISEILQDLINNGEVASFIDNIIVEMKKENRRSEIWFHSKFTRPTSMEVQKALPPIKGDSLEGHDKVVEEVVKILAENDLYLKQKKYKWKIRKVGFLGVVIGLKRINMEEEKIKEVLYLPTPKGIKDIQKFL